MESIHFFVYNISEGSCIMENDSGIYKLFNKALMYILQKLIINIFNKDEKY